MDTKTIDLFAQLPVMPTLEERVQRASAVVTDLFEKRVPVICATSMGKDSSTCLAITLNAAAAHVAAGGEAYVIVTNSDTRVESPEVAKLVKSEIAKAAAFAQANGIAFESAIVRPSLAASVQMQWLTGRSLPTYPGAGSACSIDLKVNPQRQHRTKLLRRLKKQGWAEPVTILGSRLDESERRRAAMLYSGIRSDAPVRNKAGDLTLALISEWTSEDVFEYLGMASSGVWSAYSDFADTLRVYAHSAGTSCAVVADGMLEGSSRRKAGGCSSRTGCFTCQVAEDKSLKAMVQFDEQYAYARGLTKLNDFLRAIRYDWSRRNWVSRPIMAGYVCVEPTVFSPSTIRELGRYMLQLDHDERVRSRAAGEDPMFEILPGDMIVAIDAMQSLNGVARPFQMWADYHAITSGKVRYDIPEIAAAPRSAVPEPRFLHVGNDWDDSASMNRTAGLRDSYIESLTADSHCAPILTTIADGRPVWQIDTAPAFEVATDAFDEISQFELPRLLKKHAQGYAPGGVTSGYLWYVQLGALKVARSQQSKHDEIARRTQLKDRLGLTVDCDTASLIARSIAFSELPAAARKAWAHKATDVGAQTGFLEALDAL